MTVRWGFLGAGRIARHLAWVVGETPGAEVVAVGGSSVRRAASLGVGRPGTYADVVADPEVDVVYVALANHLHDPWVRAALDAGKHVLCEKPLLTDADPDAASDRLVEALMWRWAPWLPLVSAAPIGTVEHVAAGFAFAGADGWRLDPDLGGGALHDVGCYPVSAAIWAAGPVVDVACRRRGIVAASLLLGHAGGATSELVCSMDDPARQWLVVTGSAGEVEVRGDVWTGDVEVLVSDGTGTERTRVAGGGYAPMVAAVGRWATGVPPPDGWVLPLAESRAVAAVIASGVAAPTLTG